ncbi:MAG: alpha/beta fold hydrolase [Streptosporangiaceae bacterium]
MRMHELIPGAQLAVLPGSTHMSLLRRTALIRPLIEEFLG